MKTSDPNKFREVDAGFALKKHLAEFIQVPFSVKTGLSFIEVTTELGYKGRLETDATGPDLFGVVDFFRKDYAEWVASSPGGEDKPIRECAFQEHDERIRSLPAPKTVEELHDRVREAEKKTLTNLAQVKQDSRLWSPADMIRTVANEMEDNTYRGRKVTKAAVVLYADDEEGRGVVVVQAQCSMLELTAILDHGKGLVMTGQVVG